MKKIISAVCAFALSVCVLPQGIYAHENADSTEKVIEIHVSPKGADNNNGTPENPLKTLDGARKRVLKVKDPDKQIKVIFHDGEYRMTESTKFTRNDRNLRRSLHYDDRSGNRKCMERVAKTGFKGQNNLPF